MELCPRRCRNTRRPAPLTGAAPAKPTAEQEHAEKAQRQQRPKRRLRGARIESARIGELKNGVRDAVRAVNSRGLAVAEAVNICDSGAADHELLVSASLGPDRWSRQNIVRKGCCENGPGRVVDS